MTMNCNCKMHSDRLLWLKMEWPLMSMKYMFRRHKFPKMLQMLESQNVRVAFFQPFLHSLSQCFLEVWKNKDLDSNWRIYLHEVSNGLESLLLSIVNIYHTYILQFWRRTFQDLVSSGPRLKFFLVLKWLDWKYVHWTIICIYNNNDIVNIVCKQHV